MKALGALIVSVGGMWVFMFLFTLINSKPNFTKYFHAKMATAISLLLGPCIWPWVMVKLSNEKTPWIIIGILIPILVYILSKSPIGDDISKLFNIDVRDLNSPH